MTNRFLILVLFAFLSFNSYAQEKLNKEMQDVFDACWAIRTAIATGNKTSLKSANETFRQCNTSYFSTLRPVKSSIISLNDHFVWDEIFIDSLIKGKDVRRFAQRYAVRGASSRNGILIKTCAVKGVGTAKFSFPSIGHQEIAVIAEPKGKITLRIHCKKSKIWHKDDEDVNEGRDYRYHIFDIPKGVNETIELEVINCGKDDISFVIISN